MYHTVPVSPLLSGVVFASALPSPLMSVFYHGSIADSHFGLFSQTQFQPKLMWSNMHFIQVTDF